MTEPYLILHKVRGEPAFDVAIQLEVTEGDSALDSVWIIPTSGHRAYPYYMWPIQNLIDLHDHHPHQMIREEMLLRNLDVLIDHYACNNEASKPKPVTHVPSKTDDFLI